MTQEMTLLISRTTLGAVAGAFSEHFYARTEAGETVLELKYKAHFGSQEWSVLDGNGRELGKMERHAHMHPQFDLRLTGLPDVTVRKANFMQVRETWRVEGLPNGALDVSGDILDHEFSIVDGAGSTVAQASRKWVTLHDGYSVRITGLDPVVAVCTVIGLDVIEHEH